MANIQQLYHNATGRSALSRARLDELPSSPAEDATRKQLRINWLQSSVTQEIFDDLGREADTLIDSAIVLAVSYPTTQNHLQIVQNLVRANQIRNTINKYAKPS